jgi:preprotein translocase subunit SecY
LVSDFTGEHSATSILLLGIMPYILSVVVQLMRQQLYQNCKDNGESGRKKINQITR